MKTLYLARHAKSSWNTKMIKDFDRPLNERGKIDAIKMAEEMSRLSWLPDKIIASPAMRVIQTCNTYSKILNYPLDSIEWKPEIYEAYTITLFQLLTTLDEDVNNVMLIGHNPAMEDLLVHLCGYSKVTENLEKDGKIFTTANIAKLSIESSWKDLASGVVDLEKILRPKEL